MYGRELERAQLASASTFAQPFSPENAWMCLCVWNQMVSKTQKGY